jgi:hypothetical protein
MMDRVRVGPVKGLKIAIAAFVLSVFLAALVLGLGVYVLTDKSDEGSETHDGVCALIADLELRTDGTRLFLKEHPQGTAGIPASTLRESLHNQERTIDALSVVSC